MYQHLFDEFLISKDTFHVYSDDERVFVSNKERLLPLIEYIENAALLYHRVVIFDKVMGNAAALLSVKADCSQVYSPLGSRLAIRTLDEYGVGYHIIKIIPNIQQLDCEEMCPMEELSIDKNPEEFYKAVRNILNGSKN